MTDPITNIAVDLISSYLVAIWTLHEKETWRTTRE